MDEFYIKRNQNCEWRQNKLKWKLIWNASKMRSEYCAKSVMQMNDEQTKQFMFIISFVPNKLIAK